MRHQVEALHIFRQRYYVATFCERLLHTISHLHFCLKSAQIRTSVDAYLGGDDSGSAVTGLESQWNGLLRSIDESTRTQILADFYMSVTIDFDQTIFF